VVLREFHDVFLVDDDERRDILAPVADDHRVRDVRREFQQVFNVLRRDVFPARRDDQVFFAVGDLEIAFLIDFPDVAGVEPAALQRRGRGFGFLEVSLENAPVLNQNLAVFGDLHLGARQIPPHRPQLEVLRVGDVRDARGLGQPVAFADGNADALEKLQNLVRDGRRAGKSEADAVKAEPLLELPENAEIRNLIADVQIPGHGGFRQFNGVVL